MTVAPIPVDTGFIVFNQPNYPNLTGLFAQLSVPVHESDMTLFRLDPRRLAGMGRHGPGDASSANGAICCGRASHCSCAMC